MIAHNTTNDIASNNTANQTGEQSHTKWYLNPSIFTNVTIFSREDTTQLRPFTNATLEIFRLLLVSIVG